MTPSFLTCASQRFAAVVFNGLPAAAGWQTLPLPAALSLGAHPQIGRRIRASERGTIVTRTSMKLDAQLAQRRSAMKTKMDFRSVGACCWLATGTGAGLENPLGILADRSVETRQCDVACFTHVSNDSTAIGRSSAKTGKRCPGERSATSVAPALCIELHPPHPSTMPFSAPTASVSVGVPPKLASAGTDRA